MLACKAGDGPDCLTPRQVAWARQTYRGLRDQTSDEQIFPGPLPTSESDWVPPPFAAKMASIATGYFRHVFFRDPNWDPAHLDLAADITRARTQEDEEVYRTDPDLRAFVGHGGKLLLWHGWSDGALSPLTIDYYNNAIETTRKSGVGSDPPLHVTGRASLRWRRRPSQIDFLSVIEEWVEAATRLNASSPAVRSKAAELARGHCVRIRRSRPTPAREVRTTRKFRLHDAFASTLSGAIVQTRSQRVGDGIGTPARADLRIQVHQVPFDRRHRHAQICRDFLVRRPAGDLPQHLDLARSEGVGTRRRCPFRRRRCDIDDVTVPARKKRSIAATFSSCSRPAIEFSLTMRNSACGIPAATSWHSSNDPNGNAGSCVTSVGAVTRGRRSRISIRAFAALNAERACGDVACRNTAVPRRTYQGP